MTKAHYHVGPLTFVLLSLAACGPGAGEKDGQDGEPMPAAGREAATPGEGSRASLHPTAPGPNHRMAAPGWDVGIGFVRIAPDADGPPGTARADTFWIRSEAREDAPLVARAFHEEYRLEIETVEAGLQDGAVEVGYEERALPVVRAGAEGRWLQVSFAFDAEGGQRTGWVDTRSSGLEQALWGPWLRDRGVLFFVDPDSIAFFSAPDGAPERIPLVEEAGSWRYDYALYVVATEGDWMEVRVVSPSDYCGDPPDPSEARTWIRYLSAEGRPRVWYATRGC